MKADTHKSYTISTQKGVHVNIAFNGKITIDGSEYQFDVRLRQTTELIKRTAPIPSEPTANSRLLKVAEVASILGISRASVYNLLQRDELPGKLKFGCSVRVDSAVFHKWLRDMAEQER